MNIKRLICRVIAALVLCSGVICPLAAPVLGADLINVTDTLSNYTAGLTANHTIEFTTATLMPKTGKIILTIAGFNLNLAIFGATTIGGVSSNFSISPNGETATLNPNAQDNISPGTLVHIELNNITSPLTPGNYALSITTTQSNGSTPIDTGNTTIAIIAGGISTTTVQCPSSPSIYGQSVTFTGSVIPAGATGTVQFQIDGSNFGSPVALSGGTASSSSISTLTAGNHTITAIYSGDSNYTTSSGTATQTVNKATPLITWADPGDITYPAPLSNTQLNATASVAGSYTYNPPADTVLSAGDHQALNVIFSPADSIDYNPATATVYIDVISGTGSISLSDLNHTYNGNTHSVDVNTSPSGLSYTVTYDGLPAPPSGAGSYAIVATITQSGYSGSTTGTMVINPAAITVTADAKTKVHGEADPPLTYQGTLFGSDAFAGSLTRQPGEDAGVYAILQGTLTAGSNYTLTYVGANLTITGDTASITLSSLSHTYNKSSKSASVTTDPAGLSCSITYNGSATLPVNAGSYTVVATITDSNYQGTATDTLVIFPAALTVTADARTKVYGQTNPALTYQITSGTLYSGDSLTGALTRTSGENAGNYAIQRGTLSAGSNYTLTYNGANLTITKAPLTVRANSASRDYGDPNPAFTVSYSGFVNGDNASVLSGSPVLNTTATPTSPVGTYVITVTQGSLSSANYNFTFENGTLTVGSNVITITANSQSKVYGGPDPELTYSAPDGISFSGNLEREAGENVGSYTINQGTLSAGSEYTISFMTADFTITKATPVISWANPASITQGIALSAAQLNAIASTPGAFVYTPASGTILNSGDNQVLHVDFTPSDITNYTAASKDVNISVSPATSGGGSDPGGGGPGEATENSAGGGGGSSDRMYLSSYMKDTPGVFSEAVSLKGWDGICNLLIPQNTSAKTVEGWAASYITIEPVTADKQKLPAPDKGNIIGLTYNLGPEGTTFDPPITIKMLYLPEKLPSGVKDSDLVIGYWNPQSQKWETLNDCVVDTLNHIVTAPVSHFSAYSVLNIPQAAVVLPVITETTVTQPATNPEPNTTAGDKEGVVIPSPGDTPEPAVPIEIQPSLTLAMFSVDSPVFPSSPVATGQSVDLSVLVKNRGDLSGNYTLALKVNGEVTETRQVIVAGQSEQRVVFTFSQNQSGTYLIEINGLSGTIEIPSKLSGWFWPVCVSLAILGFGLTVWHIFRKSRRLSFQLP
jgi:hypothetical protein